jgi:hypothetical protein
MMVVPGVVMLCVVSVTIVCHRIGMSKPDAGNSQSACNQHRIWPHDQHNSLKTAAA